VQKKKHMPLFLVLLMIVFMFPSTVTAATAEKESLSIQDAIDTAYKSNPDLQKAYYQTESARITLNDAKDVAYIIDGSVGTQKLQNITDTYQQTNLNWESAKKTEAAEKDRISKDVIVAYINVVKSYNNLQKQQLALEDLKGQRKITSLAKELGTVASLDYDKSTSGLKQTEEAYKIAETTYQTNVASLGSLLGKSSGWNADLTSRLVADKYARNSLSVELSRGTSESLQVWKAGEALKLEENRKDWWITGLNSGVQKQNLNIAGVNYEQAKRTVASSIEQLYYSIDNCESLIETYKLAYTQAQTDLKTAQIKYQLGLIPTRALSTGDSLASAQLAEQNAYINLENARADLVNLKAQFTYLTGQKNYDSQDWTVANTKAN